MLPMWKVKRELGRISLQFGFGFSIIKALLVRSGYDRTKHQRIRISAGQVVVQRDIAIVLIYQPAGLPASLFETCQHLQTNGFAPFVVCNTPLADDDRRRLQAVSHLIMERPNFGYDFGGYRDGILHLLDAGLRPDNLLVMNDSTWFPLFDDSTLLQDIRAQDHDLFGPVYNDRIRKPQRAHLQSYMFSFKGAAIARPAFRTYWDKLILSANKQVVIRLCEMRMTRQFRDLGFSIGYKWTAADGVAALRGLPGPQLRKALDYMGELEPKIARLTTRQRQAQNPTVPQTEAAVLEALIAARPNAPYLLKLPPTLLIDILRLPFLKKDRNYPYRQQRRAYLQDPPTLPVNPVIHAEIARWDQA